MATLWSFMDTLMSDLSQRVDIRVWGLGFRDYRLDEGVKLSADLAACWMSPR